MTAALDKFKAGLRVAAIKGRDKAFADIKQKPGLVEVIAELRTAMQELREFAARPAPTATPDGGLKLTVTERDLQGRVRSFETEPQPGHSMRLTITGRDEAGRVKSFESESG